MTNLSVVVPVYNEEENVLPLFARLEETLRNLGMSYEVIFVNDGSDDGTLNMLKGLKAKHQTMRIISLKKRCGQSAALDAGIKEAQGNIIVTIDADLQNDPADIPKLLKELKDYDAVCGVRLNRQDPWLKRISSAIANFIRNKVSGETIRDTGCTLRAYKADVIKSIKLYNGMHRFIPTLLKMAGYKICEIGVGHFPRTKGRSKYNIRNRLIKPFIDLLAVTWMKKNTLNYEYEKER